MRLLVLKDTAISNTEWNTLSAELSAFYKQYADITPTFFVEDHTYQGIPTIIDSDGDTMPTMEWRKSTLQGVYDRYGNFGTDHVVLLVHRNNWIFDGIWGTNWSNTYHGYQVHLARFDHRNIANSFGTFYHEMMHSFDVLIKTTIGFDIHTLFPQWDKFCVHGGRPDKEGTTEWKYIRWKDNTKALAAIAPYLRKSYAKRLALHQERVGLMKKLVSLAEQYLVLWKARNNPKGIQ